MHKFLSAVGFSNLKKQQLELLFQDYLENPACWKVAMDSEENKFAEFYVQAGEAFGIVVRGNIRENNEFVMEYYSPVYYCDCISTNEKIEIQKHAEKETYAGVCDEVRLGVTLIFYLQNVIEYLNETKNNMQTKQIEGITLNGLSTEGKILFPVNKIESKKNQESRKERNYLIAAARNGDESAIENLTLEDMDTYSLISRRILHEDVLSIVESTFMPYGVESDHYTIIGDIVDLKTEENCFTGEMVYEMIISCNDILMGVCINKKNLLGEPEVGRRFKGTVWLQGNIIYI